MFDKSLIHALFTGQLKLSGLHEGEHVVVLSNGDVRMDYAHGFLHAAKGLGASAYHPRLPQMLPTSGSWAVGTTELANNPHTVDALSDADLVIDLAFLLFSAEQLPESTDRVG